MDFSCVTNKLAFLFFLCSPNFGWAKGVLPIPLQVNTKVSVKIAHVHNPDSSKLKAGLVENIEAVVLETKEISKGRGRWQEQWLRLKGKFIIDQFLALPDLYRYMGLPDEALNAIYEESNKIQSRVILIFPQETMWKAEEIWIVLINNQQTNEEANRWDITFFQAIDAEPMHNAKPKLAHAAGFRTIDLENSTRISNYIWPKKQIINSTISLTN